MSSLRGQVSPSKNTFESPDKLHSLPSSTCVDARVHPMIPVKPAFDSSSHRKRRILKVSPSTLYVGSEVEARLVFLRNEFTKGFCFLLDVASR